MYTFVGPGISMISMLLDTKRQIRRVDTKMAKIGQYKNIICTVSQQKNVSSSTLMAQYCWLSNAQSQPSFYLICIFDSVETTRKMCMTSQVFTKMPLS